MQVALECKQCGAILEFEEGQKIAKCKYCGSSNSVSFADKFALYNRANHLRRNNEFDRAIDVYESIVKEDPQDAEAYFGIALCKYGVEYVDDPSGKGKIPTLHRARLTSILQDGDMKNAFYYADAETAAFYQEEAEKINAIQKKIRALTNQQEKYDIFISYKEGDDQGGRTQTSVYAQEIYNELVKKGYKVFFARKTLEQKIGNDYEPIIFSALYSARVMLVIGCHENEFQGVWVRNEWTRFRDRIVNGEACTIVPIYRNMSPYELPEELVTLQAMDMGKIGFMQDLLDGLEKILKHTENTASNEDVFGNAIGKIVEGIQNRVDDYRQAKHVTDNNVDRLKAKAATALEQGDFGVASKYVERALELAPNDAECYIKKLQIAKKCTTEAELGELPESIAKNKYYQLALQYADSEQRIRYQSYEESNQEWLQSERKRKRKIRRWIVIVLLVVILYSIGFYIPIAAAGSFVLGPIQKEYAQANNFCQFIVNHTDYEDLPDTIVDILDSAVGIDYCSEYWYNKRQSDYEDADGVSTLHGAYIGISNDGKMWFEGSWGHTASGAVIDYMEGKQLEKISKRVKNIKAIYCADIYYSVGSPVQFVPSKSGRNILFILQENGKVKAQQIGYVLEVNGKVLSDDRGIDYYGNVVKAKDFDLGEVNKWKNIVDLKWYQNCLYGLQEDGKIVCVDITDENLVTSYVTKKWEEIYSSSDNWDYVER